MSAEGRLIKLSSQHTIKPFTSKSEELTKFLFDKALNFQNEILAKTFIIENDEDTIAYFSILTDSLHVQEEQFASNSAFKNF